MCKCRVVSIAEEYGYNAGKHIRIKTDEFICEMCLNNKSWYYHGNDGDYDGITFECVKCRSTVIYINDDESLFKTEYYFDENNMCVIFNFEESICNLIKNDNKSIDVPLFKFTDRADLIKKASLYITFS